MKRTAAELTAAIADFWNDYEPYSGLTYSETITEIIGMYDEFRTADIENIKKSIRCLQDVIENLDAGDEDERRTIEEAQDIINDIRDTYDIYEPWLTKDAVREYISTRCATDGEEIIDIHTYGHREQYANVISIFRTEHGPVLWETQVVKRSENGPIEKANRGIMTAD